MSYDAKIVADSISEAGDRLTTLEVTLPRIVLSEFNTHRVFSRNSASSRAIPVAKQLRKVLTTPFVPERFGRNQAGMQSYEWLEGLKHDEAVKLWLRGRDRAASTAFELLLGAKLSSEVFGYNPEREFASLDKLLAGFDDAVVLLDPKHQVENLADTDMLNVHKQITNRLLETWMWQTIIVTATEFSNFKALRTDKAAQEQIRHAAILMMEAMDASTPTLIMRGEWHLPFIQDFERDGTFERTEEARRISCARCARVSYLTHDGRRDLGADLKMADGLRSNGHMSPFEHAATPAFHIESTPFEHRASGWDDGNPHLVSEWHGNFHGWKQYRKFIPNEDDFSKVARQS